MALKYIRAFNTGSISAGGEYEYEFSLSENWNLKNILFMDRGGADLYNVQVYIKIGSDVITRDYAPARLFHPDSKTVIPIDKTVEAGTSIYFKIVNNESSAVDIDVVFVVEE